MLAALAFLVPSFKAFVSKPPQTGRGQMVTVPALGSKGVITEEELDNSGIVDWILEGDHYKEADRMYRRPVFGAND